jgi:hypothetical protein
VGYDYDDDLQLADAALASAIDVGWFVLDRSHEFEFATTASSVAELREFFATSNAYEDGPIDEATEARIDALYARGDDLMRSSGANARVVHRERTRMTRLNPVSGIRPRSTRPKGKLT